MKSSFAIISITFFLAFFSKDSKAQTIFWTETFDGVLCGLPGNSACDPSIVAWTVVNTGGNGASANRFYVSCRENGMPAGSCGTGCGANQSLHIGNVATSAAAFFFCPGGDCGAAYDASGATEVTSKRCESPTIDCSGKSTISVTFDYIERGQTTLDDATFWYYDGSTWAQQLNTAKTNNTGCLGQGRWTAVTTTLPASANNNPNVKIAFRWVNNGDGTGNDPSFAVNDVRVAYLTLLPVKLVRIEILERNNNALLEWTTATETNNDYFLIERSDNGIDFYPIGKVLGSGTTNELKNYSFLDENTTEHQLYYRIKQVDYNGEFEYFPTQSFKLKNQLSESIHIYPIPTSNILNIEIENLDESLLNFTVYSMDGKKCLSKSVENSRKINLDISSLSNGIYYLETISGGKKAINKIIKH